MLLAQVTTAPAQYGSVEIWSIASSIASVILAFAAIGITMALYWLSNRASRSALDSVGKIRADVTKLEEFFRTFHSETFRAYQDERRVVLEFLAARPDPEQAAARTSREERELRGLTQEALTKLKDAAREARVERDALSKLSREAEEVLSDLVQKTRDTGERVAAEQTEAVTRRVIRLLAKAGETQVTFITLGRYIAEACQLEACDATQVSGIHSLLESRNAIRRVPSEIVPVYAVNPHLQDMLAQQEDRASPDPARD